MGSALELHIFATDTLSMFLKYYDLLETQVETNILGRNIKPLQSIIITNKGLVA